MNAEHKTYPSQEGPTVEEAGQVLSFAEGRLKKALKEGGIEAGANVVAPYALEARNYVGPIRNKHEEITALPLAVQLELADAIADNSVDQTLWKKITNNLKKILPGGLIYVKYEEFKDGTMAALLLTGMIGSPEMQERLASRAQPGFPERVLKAILPWIIKLDMEPDTKALLALFLKTLQIKGVTLESLAVLRAAIHKVEAGQAPVTATADKTEANSMGALLPMEGNHKTSTQMDFAAALGGEDEMAA